jgi:hypothetical protein
MNRRFSFYILLALAALVALPAWAISIEIDTIDFMTQVGVRLGSGQIEMREGQTLTATVALPAVLARHGLKAKEGDAAQVTYLRGNSFRLLHVPSKLTLEFTWTKK